MDQVVPNVLPSADPVARKLGVFMRLTRDHVALLAELQANRRLCKAHSDIVVEGEANHNVHVVQEGWACSYKLLPDGRRQILNFALPGDFIGINACLFGSAKHSVAAVTDVVLSTFPARRIDELGAAHPGLLHAVNWATAREQAMLAERLVSLGRRSAYERVAHLFLELLRRLQMVGLAGDRSYTLPLTQEILADTLGLSIVHVNRTLRRLREQGLIVLESRRIAITNVGRLAAAANFEQGYLDQDRRRAEALREIA